MDAAQYIELAEEERENRLGFVDATHLAEHMEAGENACVDCGRELPEEENGSLRCADCKQLHEREMVRRNRVSRGRGYREKTRQEIYDGIMGILGRNEGKDPRVLALKIVKFLEIRDFIKKTPGRGFVR